MGHLGVFSDAIPGRFDVRQRRPAYGQARKFSLPATPQWPLCVQARDATRDTRGFAPCFARPGIAKGALDDNCG
jgi:hypothetical protein